MNDQSTFNIFTKAISNPFKIVPLITKLLKLLSDIPEKEIIEIYNTYPELKETVNKLKLLLG